MLDVGDTVDRYTIEALLGEGGMGSVYRAYDPKLHRRVALKVLNLNAVAQTPTDNPSEGAVRMLREARAAAALDHPNAVSIFDVGEVDGSPFIAMELVEGRPLRAYIGQPKVSWERRLRWLADVASALAAAHRRGLVHRDMKPENVMVRDDDVVKVLDFGIARRHDTPVDPTGATHDPALAQITGRGVIVGTLHYMSPEQMRGDALDGRSDQFSWGVLAYELLSATTPWKRSDDSLANVAELLTRDPAPLVAPDVPASVAHAVMRALSKKPEHRFPDMETLLRVLEPYVAGSSARNLAILGAEHDEAMAPTEPERSAKTDTNASKPMPPPGKPEPAPKRSLSRAILGVSVATTCIVALAIGMRMLPGDAPSAEPKVDAPTPRAKPTAVTDLPDPPTAKPEALREYRAAMQAYRDGLGAIDARLRHVVELDPTIAAAWMRLSYLTFQTAPTEARAAYAKARDQRALLTERDQAFLRAQEPWIVWQPPDQKERQRRLQELTTRYPNDAELAFHLGGVSSHNWLSKEHLAPLERAVEIDPKFANAWWQLGQQHAYLGDMDRARDALARCLDISGAATACLWNRVVIDEVEGRCEAVESDARRWTTVDPGDPLGWFTLAGALRARGRPIPAIEEVLRKQEALVPAGDRARETAMNAMRLAFVQGDFIAAEKRAREVDAIVDGAAGEPEHQVSARAVVEALLESGRNADAAKYAERYLQRREGWAADSFSEDFAVANDVVLLMLRAQRRAGTIDATTFERRRAEWTKTWSARLPGKAAGYAWIHGHAAIVETKADAMTALEALRATEMPAFVPKTLGTAFVGHTYLLAGRVDDALPLLERGAASCQELELPWAQTRAHLWLGQAREAKGDMEGACRSYAVVVERWGNAKPRSLTADEARARMKALRCASGRP